MSRVHPYTNRLNLQRILRIERVRVEEIVFRVEIREIVWVKERTFGFGSLSYPFGVFWYSNRKVDFAC